ncbi:hypothetical protein [Rubidibacter lacunae]|uniref:hypothetical protein n=1 Tax=Rubidibacter lacunae TaxID=582514 RepID=UPI0003FC8D49|nr:hypothetical protein [Rubidibacter lacunae]
MQQAGEKTASEGEGLLGEFFKKGSEFVQEHGTLWAQKFDSIAIWQHFSSIAPNKLILKSDGWLHIA